MAPRWVSPLALFLPFCLIKAGRREEQMVVPGVLFPLIYSKGL